MASDGSLLFDTEIDSSGFQKGMGKLKGSAGGVLGAFNKGMAQGTKSIASGFNSVVGTAVKVAATAGTAFAAFAIKSAADIRVMEAQFAQSFKGIENEANAAINAMAEEFNMLPNRLKEPASKFQSYFKGAGMGAAEALETTDRAMRLAADGAAFFDVGIEDSSASLKSFMMGNFQAGDAIGINANKTKIATFANEKFGKSFDDMDEAMQQQAILAYAENVYKLAGYTGQAARESDDWANVVGNMKQSLVEFAAAAAEPIMDVLISGMQKATDFIMKAKGAIEQFMAPMAGVEDHATRIAFLKDQFSGLIPILAGVAASIMGVNLAPMLAQLAQVASGFSVADISKGLDKSVTGVKSKLKTIKSTFSSAFPAMATDISMGTTTVKSALSTGMEPWKAVFDEKVQGFQSSFPKISGMFGKLPGMISTSMSGIGSAMKIGLSALAPAVLVAAVVVGLGAMYQAFGGQIDQIANMVITKGPTIINNFVQGIVSAIPGLMAAGTHMISLLSQAIVANAPALIQGGVAIIGQLVQGLISNMDSLLMSGVNAVMAVAQGLASAIPQLAVMGLQLIVSLVTSIVSNLPQIIQQGAQVVVNFIQGVAQNIPQILMLGIQLIIQLLKGIITGFPALLEAAGEIIKAILTGLLDGLQSLWEAGKKLASKILDGIKGIFGFGDEGEKDAKEYKDGAEGVDTKPTGNKKGKDLDDGMKEGASGTGDTGRTAMEEGKSGAESVPFFPTGEGAGSDLKDGAAAGTAGMSDIFGAAMNDSKSVAGSYDLNPEGTQAGSSYTTGVGEGLDGVPVEIQTQVGGMQESLGNVDLSAQGQQVATSFITGFSTGLNTLQANITEQITTISNQFNSVDLSFAGTNVATTFATGFNLGLVNMNMQVLMFIANFAMLLGAINLTIQGFTVANTFVQGMIMGLVGMASVSMYLMSALSIAIAMANGVAMAGGTMIGVSIGRGIGNGILAASGSINGALNAIVNAIKRTAGQAKVATALMMANMLAAINSQKPVIVQTMNKTMVDSLKQISNARNSFRTLMAANMAAMVSAINAGRGQVSSAMRSVMTAAVNAASGYTGSFRRIGTQLSAGLASGILAGRSGVVNAAANVARAAATAAAAAAKVASPSRVMMKIGNFWTQGLSVGILQEKDTLMRQVKTMALDIMGVYKKHMDSDEDIILGGGKHSFNKQSTIRIDEDGNVLTLVQNPQDMEVILDGKAVGHGTAQYTSQEITSRRRLRKVTI